MSDQRQHLGCGVGKGRGLGKGRGQRGLGDGRVVAGDRGRIAGHAGQVQSGGALEGVGTGLQVGGIGSSSGKSEFDFAAFVCAADIDGCAPGQHTTQAAERHIAALAGRAARGHSRTRCQLHLRAGVKGNRAAIVAAGIKSATGQSHRAGVGRQSNVAGRNHAGLCTKPGPEDEIAAALTHRHFAIKAAGLQGGGQRARISEASGIGGETSALTARTGAGKLALHRHGSCSRGEPETAGIGTLTARHIDPRSGLGQDRAETTGEGERAATGGEGRVIERQRCRPQVDRRRRTEGQRWRAGICRGRFNRQSTRGQSNRGVEGGGLRRESQATTGPGQGRYRTDCCRRTGTKHLQTVGENRLRRTSRRDHSWGADDQFARCAGSAIALEQPGRIGPRLGAGKALNGSHAGVGDQLTAVGQRAIAGGDPQLAESGTGGIRCRGAGERRATREDHPLGIDAGVAGAGRFAPIQRRCAQLDFAETGRPQLQAIGEVDDVGRAQRKPLAGGDAGELAAAKPRHAAGAARAVREAGDRAIAEHQGSARQLERFHIEGKTRIQRNATGGIGQHGPGLHRTAGCKPDGRGAGLSTGAGKGRVGTGHNQHCTRILHRIGRCCPIACHADELGIAADVDLLTGGQHDLLGAQLAAGFDTDPGSGWRQQIDLGARGTACADHHSLGIELAQARCIQRNDAGGWGTSGGAADPDGGALRRELEGTASAGDRALAGVGGAISGSRQRLARRKTNLRGECDRGAACVNGECAAILGQARRGRRCRLGGQVTRRLIRDELAIAAQLRAIEHIDRRPAGVPVGGAGRQALRGNH